jgi:putative RNA 2'-phosphotransferase
MTDASHRRRDLQKLARFIAMLLRHQPARFPVKLDAAGYADLAQVMRVLKALPNFRWATRDDVVAVLTSSGRERFEIRESASGPKIRALYGHSVLRLDYESVEPPATLYYGASSESAATLLREGLTEPERAYHRLATTPEEAHRRALRLSADPIVLVIDAAGAYADGLRFYAPVAGVYLVAAVPPSYLHQA